jgi:hypothetical protein
MLWKAIYQTSYELNDIACSSKHICYDLKRRNFAHMEHLQLASRNTKAFKFWFVINHGMFEYQGVS